MEDTEENSEKIWKIRKKILKRYGKYGRKTSRIVIRYEKYRRKASWIVKWYGKYMEEKVCWIVKWYGKHGRKVSWNVKR